MRHVPLAGMAAAVAALAGAGAAQAACTVPAKRPVKTFALKRDAINTRAFVKSVRSALGDDLMGYVVLLQGRAGRVIAAVHYGWAQSPCEKSGGRPFNRHTTTAWASVTKMITTAAVINTVERTNRSLDDKMADFLPRRWKVGTGWQAVKISHLLSYQGGFRGSKGKSFRERVSTNATEGRVGVRRYNNSHFSIFHYMGGFFRPRKWRQIEDGYRSGEIPYDSYVFAHTRTLWKRLLSRQIFKPIGIKGDCARIDFNGPDYALFYQRPDSKKGYFVNPQDTKNCASGGIVMSPRHMGKFVHALVNTNKIISKQAHSRYLTVTGKNLMGWNNNLRVADGQAFFKAGGANQGGSFIPGNTARGRTGANVMAFPGGMTAVIVINSRKPKNATWSLKNVLRDAYNAGLSAK